MGEQLLITLGTPFQELIKRHVILLKYLVKIIYFSHLLEITSIVDTSSFPYAPHSSYAIHPSTWKDDSRK